jgi:hypothetical protein
MNELQPEDRLSHFLRGNSNLVDEVGATLCGSTFFVVRPCGRPRADELRGHVLAAQVSRQLSRETHDGSGQFQEPLGDVRASSKARSPFDFPVPCSLFRHAPGSARTLSGLRNWSVLS